MYSFVINTKDGKNHRISRALEAQFSSRVATGPFQSCRLLLMTSLRSSPSASNHRAGHIFPQALPFPDHGLFCLQTACTSNSPERKGRQLAPELLRRTRAEDVHPGHGASGRSPLRWGEEQQNRQLEPLVWGLTLVWGLRLATCLWPVVHTWTLLSSLSFSTFKSV